MKCEVCGKRAPEDNATLFRVNPIGEIGIWRCWKCMTLEQQCAIDPETKHIVTVISAGSVPANATPSAGGA